MNIFNAPSWFTICLAVIFSSIFIMNLIFVIMQEFTRFNFLKKSNNLQNFIIIIPIIFYSILLVFIIANSQYHQKQIASQISEEAFLSDDLLRTTNAFPEKIKLEMQEKIKSYIKSVIEDEWPLMYKKMESPYTLIKLEEMRESFYNFHPRTEQEKLWFSQSLEILSQYNNARLNRIYLSWKSIGLFPWIALIIGEITLLLLLFFLGTKNTWAQVINLLSIGWLSFVVCVTAYAMDNPFRSPIKIQPKAFQIVYNHLERTLN